MVIIDSWSTLYTFNYFLVQLCWTYNSFLEIYDISMYNTTYNNNLYYYDVNSFSDDVWQVDCEWLVLNYLYSVHFGV